MMRRFVRVLDNTMLLIDFVVNIDRYVNTWSMMMTALSTLCQKSNERVTGDDDIEVFHVKDYQDTFDKNKVN